MTKNGWCRTNYHSDGKRRFAILTNGLCVECELKLIVVARSQTAQKILELQKEIFDLEIERNRINCEIDRLRFELTNQTRKNHE
ncbi:MAG: hypothetical protein WCD53_16535 [Microcoleus sp.]